MGFVGFVEVDWGCCVCCCFGAEDGEGWGVVVGWVWGWFWHGWVLMGWLASRGLFRFLVCRGVVVSIRNFPYFRW